ncbi:DUF4178 domain-containing protein [Candidatus Uhrbacteria bacterium]|nr:DUF4178 domain-containing protein [Candidatus Uhrbacteria bacterium]
MTIDDLLTIQPGARVSIANRPFSYVGRSGLKLDDDSIVYWLYGDDDELLSVTPDDEELVLFESLEDELEPDDSVFFRGKEYEFSYESAGKITQVEGEADTEMDDRYLFSEYQSPEGERLRIVTNENTGEVCAYLGHTISEDDLNEI